MLDLCHLTEEPTRSHCRAYIYQLVMHEHTTNYGFLTLFNVGVQAHIPIGDAEFQMPMSFIIGACDWVLYCDNHDELNMHWGEILVKKNQEKHGDKNCQYHLCPRAGHNMQYDNVADLVKIIINDYKHLKLDKEES